MTMYILHQPGSLRVEWRVPVCSESARNLLNKSLLIGSLWGPLDPAPGGCSERSKLTWSNLTETAIVSMSGPCTLMHGQRSWATTSAHGERFLKIKSLMAWAVINRHERALTITWSALMDPFMSALPLIINMISAQALMSTATLDRVHNYKVKRLWALRLMTIFTDHWRSCLPV